MTVRAKPPLASADPRTADKRTAHERGATGRAVFVRHFPPATTEFDLRATFGAFGAIAADGVTLRASKTQKSETAVEKHAFVAFEDESGFTNTMTAVREGREVLVLARRSASRRSAKSRRRGAARRREAPRRGSIPGEASGVRVSGGPRAARGRGGARARPGGARVGRGGPGASRQEVEKVHVEKRTESDEFRTESPAARRERFVSNRNHRPRRRMHDSLTVVIRVIQN